MERGKGEAGWNGGREKQHVLGEGSSSMEWGKGVAAWSGVAAWNGGGTQQHRLDKVGHKFECERD